MNIEVCDICHQPVNDYNKTEVIIKDHKGFAIDFEYGFTYSTHRKFKGVICDDCLDLLRGEGEKE